MPFAVQHARDIRQEDQAFGGECGGHFAGGRVRVDVKKLRPQCIRMLLNSDRSEDGKRAVFDDTAQGRAIDAFDLSNEAQLGVETPRAQGTGVCSAQAQC